MPEGDTLRRLADRIDADLSGAVIERAAMRDPRLATVELGGRTILGADAYGKHLFVRFDHGRTLHAHLLMTGRFEVGRAARDEEWKRRVELWTDRGRLTAVEVPVLELISTSGERDVTGQLGPDLCRPDDPPNPDEVADRLRVSPDRPLVEALLDQRAVAGFGNIYVNDVPFICGVHPEQPVGSVEGLADLVGVGTALIRTNAQLGPQNTTGRKLHTDARWVHGVGRRPCQICGQKLNYRPARESAWGRSITWCEACQPFGTVARVDLVRARRLIGLHPAVRQAVFPPASR